jgi:hypothetical protein
MSNAQAGAETFSKALIQVGKEPSLHINNKKGDDLGNFQTLGVAFTASRFGRFNNWIE